MKILSISIKIILFLFVVTAAYNLLFSIIKIYNIEWYSLYFENDVIGLFMGSFFLATDYVFTAFYGGSVHTVCIGRMWLGGHGNKATHTA